MKKSLLFLLPLIILLCPAGQDFPSASNFNFDIRSHHLRIQIDPPKHFLEAEDRLEIDIKGGRPQILSFLLNPKLKITRIVDLRTRQPLHWSETPFSSHAKRLDISLQYVKESLSLHISYEGPIHDPVLKERQLHFVRGDQTSGLISPEGVYLSSTSHWYPDRPNSRSIFNVESTIAAPYRIVTQGELLSEKLENGLWKSRWMDDLPTESLTLVAGKYSVNTREVDGIKISTYFFPEDDRFSEVFLNATEEYLKIHSNLLGPYPFKKFDIVQNFFSSGYGIPTFTLLAPDAIRQGKEFLRPGALDHEVAHSWWGHYVSGKPGTGNWVEALTTYCTNYYHKELKLGEESARKHRHDVLQKYAIQVPFSKDYPLRQFLGKSNELDGQIGYGKGSMVFHMLRQIVGKDFFFATLRKFSKQYGGRQASWEDIKKIFEEASGRSLDLFFSQWLDRPGGPQLKLENVGVKVRPKGYEITGEVVQEGEVYQLLLPMEVDDETGKKNLLFEVSQRRHPFSVEVPRFPLALTIDPDHHLFRRLYPEEIVPGLNVLLEDPEKIFVFPEGGDEESQKIYIELANMARAKKGGEVLTAREMTEDKILKSSLMLLGKSWKEPIFSILLSTLPNGICLEKGVFFVNGRKVEEKDESLLLTFHHPLQPGKFVTIYFGSSAQALSRARYIFFYGWDSAILFKNGRPKERISFSPGSSSVSHHFPSSDDFIRIEPQQLRNHVSYLASPELAGRLPGTGGYEKAQAYRSSSLRRWESGRLFNPSSSPSKMSKKQN